MKAEPAYIIYSTNRNRDLDLGIAATTRAIFARTPPSLGRSWAYEAGAVVNLTGTATEPAQMDNRTESYAWRPTRKHPGWAIAKGAEG